MRFSLFHKTLFGSYGRSMRVERVSFRLICVATVAVILAACGQKQSAPPPQTPEVGVVTVQPTKVPVTTELPGRTSAFLMAQVRARVDGIVLRREFTEGADVKAGQRLYKIDPAPFIAALNTAKASLAKAQANLATQNAQAARFKILVAANAVSKQDYDNAVATQGQAAADVASGKAAVRHRADQPRLHGRRLAHHGPHRRLASHAGRLRAGKRRHADGHGATTGSGLRRPDAVERGRSQAAPRYPGRTAAHRRRQRGQGHADPRGRPPGIRKSASCSSPT